MRINYNFPYYRERLSPRQKARMAAESQNQQPEIILEGQTIPILRIRTSVTSYQKSDHTNIETGSLKRVD
ncbi:MAG: hypothetical protein IJH67_10035 [Thermoguttaceae bacterium]|nr:hypothetical protein [Thermoguttaceae bacterium]